MKTDFPGWKQNARPCGECAHFFPYPEHNKLGGCKKKLMAILSNMQVLAPVGQPCFEKKESA